MMLKPSAAPPSNHSWMASATWTGVPALGTLDLVLAGQALRQSAVQGQVLRSHAQGLGELDPGVLGFDQPVQFPLQLQGFRFGGADNRHDAGEDLDAFRITADGGGGLQVPVEVLRIREGLVGGEDGVRVPRGEVLAVLT